MGCKINWVGSIAFSTKIVVIVYLKTVKTENSYYFYNKSWSIPCNLSDVLCSSYFINMVCWIMYCRIMRYHFLRHLNCNVILRRIQYFVFWWRLYIPDFRDLWSFCALLIVIPPINLRRSPKPRTRPIFPVRTEQASSIKVLLLWRERESIPHTSLIPQVMPLRLFLDRLTAFHHGPVQPYNKLCYYLEPIVQHCTRAAFAGRISAKKKFPLFLKTTD